MASVNKKQLLIIKLDRTMIAPNELTEEAFHLYKNISELSKKPKISRYQEKYFLCLADKCFTRYERRLMKFLGCNQENEFLDLSQYFDLILTILVNADCIVACIHQSNSQLRVHNNRRLSGYLLSKSMQSATIFKTILIYIF